MVAVEVGPLSTEFQGAQPLDSVTRFGVWSVSCC
jgi:hypothetical protein